MRNYSKSYFGSNLEKARRNYEAGVPREKLSFQRKYPSADAKDFVFDADLSKTGDLIRTFTKYRDKGGGSLRDHGIPFQKNLRKQAVLATQDMGPERPMQPLVLDTDPLPYDLRKFKIYVNEKEGFLCNFEALETS